MWLPNDTPEYWSAREREFIAKHDKQRMARAARRAEVGGTLDPTKPVASVLTGCRSAVTRVRAAVRTMASAAMMGCR